MTTSYARNYNRAVKFSADSRDVGAIARTMTHEDWSGGDQADDTKRGILADAYEDHTGDTEGANHLRTEGTPVAFHNGQMKRGVLRYREAVSDPTDGAEFLPFVDEHGSGVGLRHAVDNYDFGEGRLYPYYPGPRGGRVHSDLNTGHTLHYNPTEGHWGLIQEHVVPEENAHHNYMASSGTTHVPEFDH